MKRRACHRLKNENIVLLLKEIYIELNLQSSSKTYSYFPTGGG